MQTHKALSALYASTAPRRFQLPEQFLPSSRPAKKK
jgi:hypothetical protein